MRKEIFVHVGSVKTGTSYLQRVFELNRQTLADHGFAYPSFRQITSERWANGNILRDKRSAGRLRREIEDPANRAILLSEEGLFSDFKNVLPDYFRDHHLRIICYIRDPYELIGAWLAEMSKPYNCRPDETVAIEQAVPKLCDRYLYEFWGFLDSVDVVGVDKVIVRPFARPLLAEQSLEVDFCEAISHPEMVDWLELGRSDRVNSTPNRKYCDISIAVHDRLAEADRLYQFSEELVNAINLDCQSGDDRPVADTIMQALAAYEEPFARLDEELAKRFAWEPEQRGPRKAAIHGPFEPVRPVRTEELEYLLLRQTVVSTIAGIIEDGNVVSREVDEATLMDRCNEALALLEGMHANLLHQRSELLRMRRLARPEGE